MVVGVAGRSAATSSSGRRSCSATWRTAETGEPDPVQPYGTAASGSHEAVRPGAHLDRRPQPTRSTIPTATRSSSSRPCSAAGCRRGSSPRCASGAGSPTTSTGSTTATPTPGTLYAQAGVDINRIDEAVRRSPRAAPDRRRAGALGRAREGAELRQGPLRPPAREPAGADPLRPAPRGARGRLPEPEEVLAGLDAVTAEDVQRVAQDVIAARRLRLAVIGPFDDARASRSCSTASVEREAGSHSRATFRPLNPCRRSADHGFMENAVQVESGERVANDAVR